MMVTSSFCFPHLISLHHIRNFSFAICDGVLFLKVIQHRLFDILVHFRRSVLGKSIPGQHLESLRKPIDCYSDLSYDRHVIQNRELNAYGLCYKKNAMNNNVTCHFFHGKSGTTAIYYTEKCVSIG